MNKRLLIVKQLDRQLEGWRGFYDSIPAEGWIRTIRKSIGMTTKQLAKRLKVNRSRVVKIEQAEPEGALTLRTLEEVAQSLNCRLVYALVPQIPLRELVEEQAKKVAIQRLGRVSHSMLLEDQSVESDAQQEQLTALVNQLLSASLKNIWEDE
ncbi:MAG: mobile mystery protein A [Gammaproteobacteria bacterium]|nr:mobile mystery protein A [Gammaproteobacteria bacterium]